MGNTPEITNWRDLTKEQYDAILRLPDVRKRADALHHGGPHPLIECEDGSFIDIHSCGCPAVAVQEFVAEYFTSIKSGTI
jgi:hypothetical protein